MGDEVYYKKALKEFDETRIDDALLAKAKVMAEGKHELIKYKYVELRIEQMKAERRMQVAGAAVDAGVIIVPAIMKIAGAVAVLLLGLFIIAGLFG